MIFPAIESNEPLTPKDLRGYELELRKADAGMTANKVAALLGIHPTTLSRMKTGKLPIPTRVQRNFHALINALILARVTDPMLRAKALTKRWVAERDSFTPSDDDFALLLFGDTFNVLWNAALNGDPWAFRRALVDVGEMLRGARIAQWRALVHVKDADAEAALVARGRHKRRASAGATK
jgi:hypothetical protein